MEKNKTKKFKIEKKERPIIFSTPMVQAILEGRKTQTRRIVKGLALEWLTEFTPQFVAHSDNSLCPYGKIGDLLWVRETWFPTKFNYASLKSIDYIKYRADNNFDPQKDCYGRSWKPSIHMPKWVARIWLEIINIKVEQLQQIKPEDIQSEGIDVNLTEYRDVAYMPFASLWDSLNAKRGYSWGSNPWVWVIEFKRIEK